MVGGTGSLFSFATIYPEVVERHQIIAGYAAAPQSHITPATGILCACPPSVVRFGGGYRLGRLLGGGTEKRPPCPHLNLWQKHIHLGYFRDTTVGRFSAIRRMLERTNEMIPSCQDGCQTELMELLRFLWRTDEINAQSSALNTDGKGISSIG